MDRKMLNFKSYGIVPNVPGVRILKISWVLHWNGIFEKNKDRLVQRSNYQESGIDFNESSSSVMGLESSRTSSHSGLMLISHLPASQYLQGGDLYGWPGGYADPRERNWVWYLKKGLCGLVQARRTWSEELDSYAKSEGFLRCSRTQQSMSRAPGTGRTWLLGGPRWTILLREALGRN